jgi:hypothetical protein
MIQAIVATRILPANTRSSKRARCGLFQRANDGGQILRWERSLLCRFIWFNEGKRFVVSFARPAPSLEGAVTLGNAMPTGSPVSGYRLGLFPFAQ